MPRLLLALTVLVSLILPAAQAQKPPSPPVRNVVDEYYGTKVQDPYRYMEKLDDPEVTAWFKAQAAYTDATLGAIPGRKALLARIQELDARTPARVHNVRRFPGDRIYYEKRLASENIFKLYVRDGFAGAERMLIDPEKYRQERDRAHGTKLVGAIARWTTRCFRHVAGGFRRSRAAHRRRAVRQAPSLTQSIAATSAKSPGPRTANHSHTIACERSPPDAKPVEKYLNSHVYLHLLGRDPEQGHSAVWGRGSRRGCRSRPIPLLPC